jgi:tRNA dimethylallyltransferase
MKPIIFIVGPTAIGKSEVSFLLAEELKAEIISADSMLIYREPQIIVSKPSKEVLTKIKHYFIDIISVEQTYNVFNYYQAASAKIKELSKKEKNLIVCGGSGLYIKALCDGIYEGIDKNQELRQELLDKAKIEGNQYLYQELKKVDPVAAEKISANDLKRIIRALEVFYLCGVPISQKQQQSKGLWNKFPLRLFGLTQKRDDLYKKINLRTDEMFELGALAEVKELLKLDLSLTARQIIGIKEISGYLKGECSIEEAKEVMKKNTRNFAKRQLTWFRKDKRIEWIDIDNLTPEEIVREILYRFK